MTANDSKSHLPDLNKSVDQYNNSYHHSINKNPINADYSGQPIDAESELLSMRIFSRRYTKNWSTEVFIIDSVLKTNPGAYRTKDLNGERIIESF